MWSTCMHVVHLSPVILYYVYECVSMQYDAYMFTYICTHVSVCACGVYMFGLLISLKLIKVASSGRHKTKKHRGYNSLQVVFHA